MNKLIPYLNSRLMFVMAFGFSSGLPFALTGSTLQAWLTQANVSLMAMGIFSLISFPYNCKFLWAPLLDRFSILRLGRRRGWLLLTQLGLAFTLLVLASMNPQSQLQAIG
ncbi:MAG TPA: AmpG family muropeptide MFS transporter, partial [Gammaproteobacteria bacterium]|nr:AmpG family muropeptide MFS transporter [Gammaproteobacteria bacterium]